MRSKLQELGLSNAQIDVYITILRLGEAKAGSIQKEVTISSSNIYIALEKLLEQGFISFIVKNKIKHYYPTDPKNLSEVIKKQKTDLKHKENVIESLIPEIASIKQETQVLQNAQVFIGLKGLDAAYGELLKDGKKDDKLNFFYTHDGENIEEVQQYFAKTEQGGRYNTSNMRGVVSKEYEPYLKKRKASYPYKTTSFPIPSNLNTYNNKTLIISWGKQVVSFLITSKEITKTFNDLFEEVWEKS
jgi:sugar-specific transcriptional regulator TrmB